MAEHAADSLSPFMQRELTNLMCGRELGSGASRRVFQHALDAELVIKFESAANSFSNVREWDVWQAVRDTDLAAWFAPCIAISACGSVLVQQRTHVRAGVSYPDKLPVYFTDTKLQNYGWIQNEDQTWRFVCHDYGLHLMLENGMTKRMRKANWWSANGDE